MSGIEDETFCRWFRFHIDDKLLTTEIEHGASISLNLSREFYPLQGKACADDVKVNKVKSEGRSEGY